MQLPSINLNIKCYSNCFKCLPRSCSVSSCCKGKSKNSEKDEKDKSITPESQSMTEAKTSEVAKETMTGPSKHDHHHHHSHHHSHHGHHKHGSKH